MGEIIELPVTVDKSHIITIGEKLYSESIELIRELVNNAYDADATLVEVTVNDESIEVKDNGSGMDLEGLKQYFNIGSQEKLIKTKSPMYRRDRIGQFGIGKFASLAAANRFEVYTQQENFAAQVIFDKKEWEKHQDRWYLPLEILEPDLKRGNGTTVTLKDLTKKFIIEDVERKIIEGVPLKAPNFSVKINGHIISPRSLSGHRVPFLEGTEFGVIHGEIIVLPLSGASTSNLGIECKVKHVTIRRELFGMESWGKTVARIKGEVHADFLPITSDRSGFIMDSPEYQAFMRVMQKVMQDVKSVVSRLTDRKENRVASRALKEALERIYRSLRNNPDLSPFGAIPVGQESIEGLGGAAAMETGKGTFEKISSLEEKKQLQVEKKIKPSKKGKSIIKMLTPNAVIKRVKFGQHGVSCCLDHFGEDGPECFAEGSTIYINRDHPLYKRESKKLDAHTLNLARLLTQEISMMKDPKNPRQAFERQSKLLRDAFRE